jgi:hypothetical protein
VTGTALELPISAKGWQLRGAWATGRRVAVTIDSPDLSRAEGFVTSVSATNAYLIIAGWHVPLDAVLAVHFPSLLGDSTWDPKEGAWRGKRRQIDRPGQTEFPFR